MGNKKNRTHRRSRKAHHAKRRIKSDSSDVIEPAPSLSATSQSDIHPHASPSAPVELLQDENLNFDTPFITDTTIEAILGDGEISGVGILPPSPDKSDPQKTTNNSPAVESPAWKLCKENRPITYGKRSLNISTNIEVSCFIFTMKRLYRSEKNLYKI